MRSLFSDKNNIILAIALASKISHPKMINSQKGHIHNQNYY